MWSMARRRRRGSSSTAGRAAVAVAGRAAVAAVTALAAASCSAGGPACRGSPPPPFLSHLLGQRACRGAAGFTCGQLMVPLDPFGPPRGRLSLQVAVSDVAAAPDGVLLFLTGGPGQPGVPFVQHVVSRSARRSPATGW